MAYLMQVNSSGTWKRPRSIQVKDAGAWKPVQRMYIYDNNQWVQTWTPNMFDPNAIYSGFGSMSLSNSNRTASMNGANIAPAFRHASGFPHGKWYFEVAWTLSGGTAATSNIGIGVCDEYFNYASSSGGMCGLYGVDGKVYNNMVAESTAYSGFTPWTTTQRASCAFNVDTRSVYFYLNGVLKASRTLPYMGTQLFPCIWLAAGATTSTITCTLQTTMSYTSARPDTSYNPLTI